MGSQYLTFLHDDMFFKDPVFQILFSDLSDRSHISTVKCSKIKLIYLMRTHLLNMLSFFQVYAASNVELITKTRISHLPDQNKNKTKGRIHEP